MDLVKCILEVRRLSGNPNYRAVDDTDFRRAVESSLEWLAGQLEYEVRTDAQGIALTAETQEYGLAPNVRQVFWVEWNGARLEPSSTWDWDRRGIDWRNAASGNPTEYAVEGRRLVLYPKPDSTAVSTDGAVTFRYLSSPDLQGEHGNLMLGDTEWWLIAYKAADEWLALHPSEQNAPRQAFCANEWRTRLPDAKRRARNMVAEWTDRVHVFTRRGSAAR